MARQSSRPWVYSTPSVFHPVPTITRVRRGRPRGRPPDRFRGRQVGSTQGRPLWAGSMARQEQSTMGRLYPLPIPHPVPTIARARWGRPRGRPPDRFRGPQVGSTHGRPLWTGSTARQSSRPWVDSTPLRFPSSPTITRVRRGRPRGRPPDRFRGRQVGSTHGRPLWAGSMARQSSRPWVDSTPDQTRSPAVVAAGFKPARTRKKLHPPSTG